MATQNTARVVAAVDADVIGVIETEDRPVLKCFNNDVLPIVKGNPYDRVMVIDGNA